MDDCDHNTQADNDNLPAVVDPRPVIPAPGAQQRPTRWHSSTLPDRLRRASRHPAVAGSLVTAAGLLLHVALRRTLPAPGQLARLAGSAITPTPSAAITGESWVMFTRTVVVQTWTVRGPQL
ncbi:MAG: hypothetical protein ACRDQH_18315 [Pseudonocardiaceae bacterium]